MADKPKRSISETIRLWVEAVGIPIVLAALGLWQFWLKEVKWPAQAPVNLTTEVRISEAGLSGVSARDDKGEDHRLEAIELEVTARNASTRPVYLLRNLWEAFGVTVEAAQKDDWMETMATHLNGDHRIGGGKHYLSHHPIPVAVGNAFTDTALLPNEKIVRTFVFYVPRGVYDFVEVDVGLPSTAVERSNHPGEPIAGVEYSLTPDRSNYSPTFYRIKLDGTHEDTTGTDTEDLGVQWAISTRMLSLWQTNAPPPNVDAKPVEASP